MLFHVEIVDPNACTPTRLRGKRKNNEDDDVQRQEMDIRRRVHHIVRNINPHTYPNGKFSQLISLNKLRMID